MNKFKIIIIGILATCLASGSMAQSVDENQMDQDIEVMEGILNQMFFRNYKNNLGKKEQVSGNYLPGFGLIFKIPRYESYFLGPNVSDDIFAVIADENSQLIMGKNIFSENKMDSIQKASNNHFKETVQSFFIDYGDLIGQLGVDDNILIVFGSNTNKQSNNFINNPFILKRLKDGGVEKIKPGSKITAQVSFNDILNYKRGKINERQFVQNIRFSEKSLHQIEDQEFIILTSIFEKIYGHHAGSFGNNQPIGFERVEGLGVIYEMSLRGWSANPDKLPTLYITSDVEGEEDKKDQKIVNSTTKDYIQNSVTKDYIQRINDLKKQQNEVYQEFKTKLKQNLIKYGKTLKSLENDEILMLATKLSDCFGCEKPEKLNLIVKASVLKDYDQRKITLDQAVTKIIETELRSNKE